MADRLRPKRLNLSEIQNILSECESDEEEFIVSDDEYIPPLGDIRSEASDAELVPCIETDEDSYDSDDSEEVESYRELCGKDGTRWRLNPFPEFQTINRNILRQRCGPAPGLNISTSKDIFKSILSSEMCDIMLRETNRKGIRSTEGYNRNLQNKYPNPNDGPKNKIFIPFTECELDAFFGILMFCGVHKSNKEHLTELWKPNHLPLIRAAMSYDRFKMLLRFIRFDNEVTRQARAANDKAAAIRDIWIMLNSNLHKYYKPGECITIDEQLYGYRGRTRFTQYMPSKPEKYGIKIFWACDSKNSYPLQGQLYTGKPTEGDRQTLVGTVRKNKRFLPSKMQAHKDRQINSTNFVFSKNATLCSYVPKKEKAVIMLSTMHSKPETEQNLTAKPEIIMYYNQTKGGVDNMDKLLGEYTKRRTNRWPLALFYNAIDVAALAAYIIYMEHNPQFTSSDRRRTFLKDLSFEMCKENIEKRIQNPKACAKLFTRSAIQDVLGREIGPDVKGEISHVQNRDATGRIAVVGSCYICKQQDHKRRKTRKACASCSNAVCSDHSTNRPICDTCLPDSQ